MIQYLKSHPGGLDLIVEESGQSGNSTTEAFEDIGHGKDARVCFDLMFRTDFLCG